MASRRAASWARSRNCSSVIMASPFCTSSRFEVEDVDDAEMHAAHFVRVVVEQRDGAILVAGAELQFLAHLALHRGVVGGAIEREETFVVIVHVPADADAALGHEPLLAGLFAAHVMQHAPLVDEQHVGNDLLERGIGLRGGRGVKKLFSRASSAGR